MLKRLLQEPLLHFALISGLIFFVTSGESTALNQGRSTIEVQRTDIARHMASLQPNLGLGEAIKLIDQLPSAQLQRLVEDVAEQEVLFQEALRLGLDRTDPVIRKRLISQMKFVLQGVSQNTPSSEADLQEFYDSNKDKYRVPTKLSFKHRFFKHESEQPSSAIKRAVDARTNEQIKGDTFPFNSAYLDKSAVQVAQHFGEDFSNALFELDAKPDQWQGPITSTYGQHLIKLTSKRGQHMPEFDQIREQIAEDYSRQQQEQSNRVAVKKLIKQYTVETELAPMTASN